MIALQAEMPCWWDSSKKFKNPFFTITEITTVISRIASQNADHVEQSEIWGHNGHRLRWCFSTLQLDRAGLPPKPVRYCGCRWILNFTHNTFPCYRIHGNGLGVMETELMVFHVLLNLLETWLHWRRPSSPLVVAAGEADMVPGWYWFSRGAQTTSAVSIESFLQSSAGCPILTIWSHGEVDHEGKDPRSATGITFGKPWVCLARVRAVSLIWFPDLSFWSVQENWQEQYPEKADFSLLPYIIGWMHNYMNEPVYSFS